MVKRAKTSREQTEYDAGFRDEDDMGVSPVGDEVATSEQEPSEPEPVPRAINLPPLPEARSEISDKSPKLGEIVHYYTINSGAYYGRGVGPMPAIVTGLDGDTAISASLHVFPPYPGGAYDIPKVPMGASQNPPNEPPPGEEYFPPGHWYLTVPLVDEPPPEPIVEE